MLLSVARNPEARVRDIAAGVGITERACYRVLADLVAYGLVARERVGRNNHYTVNRDAHFVHRAWTHVPLEPLISLVAAVSGEDAAEVSSAAEG